MRAYLALTADELKEFLTEQRFDISEVYAPTGIYSAAHPEMDEEEIEFSLSLLAAEDALDLYEEGSGAPLVIALEIDEDIAGAEDEVSIELTQPLKWEMVEAIFLVGDEVEDLTWFAPQEANNHIEDWLTR
jgi:hypothetical protein